MSQALTSRATALLARWADAVEPYWHDVVGDPPMGCYGPGYIHWGVQSNWNYAAAMATLAAATLATATFAATSRLSDPGRLARTTNPTEQRATLDADTPPPADRLAQKALSALRFALATHITGDRTGNDGRQWGHSWISMLGIERGMHGLPQLDPLLTDTDRAALRRLLVSEATWLLHGATRGNQSGIVAGRWAVGGCNVPESNIWSGALLWRVAQMYPDEPQAAAWEERAHAYFINGISIPADAEDQTVVAGKPIAERYVGANFFPNYALDHHGYLNVGYMVICASNAAMLAFDMQRAGYPVPESLTHHQADMWQVLRRFIFGDARLARIGGDSRVRYSYCQEYLLPALLFAAHTLGDAHALHLVDHQLALIEQEMDASPDGTFYGRRMGPMRDANPHYFTRLESDRACVLSMLITYLPEVTRPAPPEIDFEASVAGGWCEPDHGAVLHRAPTRLASFSWRARGLTQGLCLPPGDPTAISMAEWARNLAPVVRFLGDDGDDSAKHRRLLRHRTETFPGGFATCGAVMEGVDIRVDEGAQCTDQATTHLAFVALPDGRTCVGLQLVIAAEDRLGYLVELKGLHLNIANDCFNDFRRTFRTAKGDQILSSPPDHDGVVALERRWVVIDDVLGVALLYGSDRLLIDRSATRRGGRYHSLYVDEICSDSDTTLRQTHAGEVLIDVGFAIRSDGTVDTLQSGRLDRDDDLTRAIWIIGADNVRYELIVDFAKDTVTVRNSKTP